MSGSLKRTPLYNSHQKLGGKLIEFGGWEMPVQYTSISDEHQTVRKAAGIFDISHMGEVFVSGPNAVSFLNQALTNDIGRLKPGQGQYTLMCKPDGGVVDDLYAYQLRDQEYLLIINASRIEPDVAWLEAEAKNFKDLTLTNVSDDWGAVAIQGPTVEAFIDQVIPGRSMAGVPVDKVSELKKNEIAGVQYGKQLIWVGRTGYTGESGFEIVAPGAVIAELWEAALDKGKQHGIKPAGLGARDTLRTEMCYPLYGHELGETISPVEAGLSYFVAFDKPHFNGKEALLQQKTAGTSRKCVAFKMVGKTAPPRPGYVIWSSSSAEKIGEVVSGTQSPSLGLGIGMGYVPANFAKVDTAIEIEIRGNKYPAVVVKKPFYSPAAKKV